MADLIAPTDLAVYSVSVPTDTDLAKKLIGSASAAVIDAAQSPIIETRSTVTVTAMPTKILRLPGLPISEIHSVTVDDSAVTGWVQIEAGVYLAIGWSRDGLQRVTVDYTHGLKAVPEDIKDLVARMVIAGLLAAEDGGDGLALANGRLSSLAIDDYKEGYATGEDVEAVTEMTLPERTRERLAKRFGAGGPMVRGQL